MNFQIAVEMPYANNNETENKATDLIEKLKDYLKNFKKDNSLFFKTNETVYIPDIHGDFVHLIITLHRHGLLENDLSLKRDYKYVFLGDFYDRAPDASAIDFWLNLQIRKNIKIYRLLGNHEMAFFERDEKGHPLIFPSQDSIRDISNNFQITENLLTNIAGGNILAAYVDNSRDVARNVSTTTLYVHSYVINDDFVELGLEPNSDIINFACALNEKLKKHGQFAYDMFLENKQAGFRNPASWKAIIKSFHDDPLFNIYKKKYEISTSFIWRRTGVPILNTYPIEIDVEIPNAVYQIIGHTPVFSFNLPKNCPIHKPFVLNGKNGSGKVQFSDVGIGYYYKNDFERPEIVINKREATII